MSGLACCSLSGVIAWTKSRGSTNSAIAASAVPKLFKISTVWSGGALPILCGEGARFFCIGLSPFGCGDEALNASLGGGRLTGSSGTDADGADNADGADDADTGPGKNVEPLPLA